MPDGYTQLGSIPLKNLPHDCASMLPTDGGSLRYTTRQPGTVLQCDFCGSVWVTQPSFRSSGALYCEWARVGWWTRWKLRRAQARVDLARR